VEVGVDEELGKAVSTGKVVIGTDRSLKTLKRGEAKLIIAASNCPRETLEDLKYYSSISGVKLYIFDKDSRELGLACGKPFTVNVVVVIDPGSSGILSAVGGG
jgi:large subunit ribosomal protein L30e